jgi:hypothetical protein
MPKTKRKYTFRKGKVIPYESGSPIHQMEKLDRKVKKQVKRSVKKARKLGINY